MAPSRYHLGLLALATALDAATTTIGLYFGLPEAGPLASRLIPVLGVWYWPLQLAVLLGLYLALERLPWTRGLGFTVGLGPWVAGWLNIYRILGVLPGG